MEWQQIFPKEQEPSLAEMAQYVANPLWQQLRSHLEETYQVKPRPEYSGCGMQPGWHIKYKKNGKSLCILYPEKGWFKVLVVVGAKEQEEAELRLTACTEATQQLYQETPTLMGGRWLMLKVQDAATLRDVQELAACRVPAKQKPATAK